MLETHQSKVSFFNALTLNGKAFHRNIDKSCNLTNEEDAKQEGNDSNESVID